MADIWGNVTGWLRAASNQFKDKMKHVKQYYKDLNNGSNKSGQNHSNRPYYDLMDDVFGDRPSIRPRNVIDTTHSTPPSMSSSAPDSPSQDGSVTGAFSDHTLPTSYTPIPWHWHKCAYKHTWCQRRNASSVPDGGRNTDFVWAD